MKFECQFRHELAGRLSTDDRRIEVIRIQELLSRHKKDVVWGFLILEGNEACQGVWAPSRPPTCEQVCLYPSRGARI